MIPNSLNYLGLMNPKKPDFQYFCEECVFDENEMYKTMEFITPAAEGNKGLILNANLVSHSGLLDLVLEQIPLGGEMLHVSDYTSAFEAMKERGTLIAQGYNPHQARGGE